jgi:TrmH family RNA methyltransferase
LRDQGQRPLATSSSAAGAHLNDLADRRVFGKVTSLSNPLVKDIRAPACQEAPRRDGLFLAGGAEAGARRRRTAAGPIHSWLWRGACWREQIGVLAARTKAGGGTILEVSAQVLEKISRRDNPQSVIGVFKQRYAPESAIAQDGLWVALDRVRDPGNLGTIIRTADAAGIAGLALVGATCDPFALETVRATMGSIFHVPVARVSEEGLIAHAKRRRARLLGTHLTATTIDYREADYRPPLILLMGNEQQGLTDTLAKACDSLVRIPMREGADSLNLAVSTGLVIYEALRAKLA